MMSRFLVYFIFGQKANRSQSFIYRSFELATKGRRFLTGCGWQFYGRVTLRSVKLTKCPDVLSPEGGMR
jgi:hypothetical protein